MVKLEKKSRYIHAGDSGLLCGPTAMCLYSDTDQEETKKLSWLLLYIIRSEMCNLLFPTKIIARSFIWKISNRASLFIFNVLLYDLVFQVQQRKEIFWIPPRCKKLNKNFLTCVQIVNPVLTYFRFNYRSIFVSFFRDDGDGIMFKSRTKLTFH